MSRTHGTVICTHPVTKGLEADPGELPEVLDQCFVLPAADVLQWLWQVPVVQCHHGLYTILQQAINEGVVVVDARLVDDSSCAVWQNARPGQRETVEVDLGEQW